MKIQVNKHYIDAMGDVVYIVKYIPNGQYCFMDNEGQSYTKNGYFTTGEDADSCDLICECNTDILNKYMDKLITKKEFIQQHIEYWSKNESITD